MAKLTFWFEFASTYSALSAQRIGRLSAEADVEIIWRPFLLGPIFKAQGWETSPFNIYEAKGRYMWRDLERRAAELGLAPFHKPANFPQNGLLAARLAILGFREGWGAKFVPAVYQRQFGQGASISQAEDLVPILSGLGLNAPACLEEVKNNTHIKDALRENTVTAQSIGIFGAPSFTTEDGEIFWGDDRLEAALDWSASGAARKPISAQKAP